MKKWHQQLPFAVYSVLLSLGVGIILWATKITDEAFAILAALGLELVVVVHRVHRDLDRITDPLRGLIHSANLDEALVSARQILASKNPQARVLLESATAAYATRVKELRTGWVMLSPADFMAWVEDLFGSAKSGDTFCATSHLAGGEYWKQNYGKRYESLNRAAQLRGLAIQRTYLLRDDDHIQEYKDVLDRQSEFADIRIATFDADDHSLNVLRRDFFVFNKEVAAEFHFTHPGMELAHIQVTTDREQVKALAAQYARLRDIFSRPYKP
jgi:hypothetical protein